MKAASPNRSEPFLCTPPLPPHALRGRIGGTCRLTGDCPDYTRANFSSLTSLHTSFRACVSTFSRSALGALRACFRASVTPFDWRGSRIHIVRPLESAGSTSGHLDYVAGVRRLRQRVARVPANSEGLEKLNHESETRARGK